MKYIRANDNKIYNTSKLIKCEDKRFSDGWFTKSGVPLIAIKQADTIEELCDEFVAVSENERKLIELKHRVLVKSKYIEIYGAIWTGKGLIYVAKMNKDGELCLI